MLFNSISYAFFFPLVFIVYWLILNKSLRLQNIFLFVCSYYFYACWDWRFLFLLVFSTFLDYFSGIMIHRTAAASWRKAWLIISVAINLGFLAYFKYFNFFIDSFAELLQLWGFTPHMTTLNIVLPVGISFYTFHGLSYVFDIYYNRIKPTNNFVNYTLFVSFFPLLVAGPIERATHLLPQIEQPRAFNAGLAADGLKQILWGLFKKVVIADNCAEFANMAFENAAASSPSTLILGAIFFSFQIYGDFSGYSDIASGSARLLGFEILQNFKYPYFSRDIAEFWRRWHISLSSWFKDYLYIPLGGSRGTMLKTVRNTFIIFIVSGFWHGANWTFIIWGGLHALFIMPSILFKTNRQNLEIVAGDRIFPNGRELFSMMLTFMLATLAWIFFRAASVGDAITYIGAIFSGNWLEAPAFFPWYLIIMVAGMLMIEWIGRHEVHPLRKLGINIPMPFRWAFYFLLIYLQFAYTGNEQQFIYFQF